MAWKQLSKPYDPYVNEDPQAYTAADAALMKAAIDNSVGPGIGNVFTDWSSFGAGIAPVGPQPGKPAGVSAPTDFRSLIESDPFYQQAKADASAGSISDAASRARAIKQVFIDWGVMPDMTKTAQELGISQDTYDYLKADLDPQTGQFASQNEAEGLSRHARLDKANTDNIASIRNALAARGMYTSGELPTALTDNAQQYKQASHDAMGNVLGSVEEISGKYASGEAQRRRDLASAGSDAAGRVASQVGSSGSTNAAAAPGSAGGAIAPGTTAGGIANWAMPSKLGQVWDVNTASTFDAINAAKSNGGSVVIRPDDPEAQAKAKGAAEAGVPVSIQVNGDANDTPQTLALKVAQYGQMYPGASFTLDLESPNFRGGAGTPGGDQMAAYAQQVQTAAPNTPITITTEGVSDFNYGAWASNPNVTFAPQCYWGDMTPRDVSSIVALLTAQGIPADRIVPVVAPGQNLGSYTGPVSVYGAPRGGAPSQPGDPTGTDPRVTPPNAMNTPPAQLYSQGYDPWAVSAIAAAQQAAAIPKAAPRPVPVATGSGTRYARAV